MHIIFAILLSVEFVTIMQCTHVCILLCSAYVQKFVIKLCVVMKYLFICICIDGIGLVIHSAANLLLKDIHVNLFGCVHMCTLSQNLGIVDLILGVNDLLLWNFLGEIYCIVLWYIDRSRYCVKPNLVKQVKSNSDNEDKVSLYNHQADSPLYVWPDVWSGYLQA